MPYIYESDTLKHTHTLTFTSDVITQVYYSPWWKEKIAYFHSTLSKPNLVQSAGFGYRRKTSQSHLHLTTHCWNPLMHLFRIHAAIGQHNLFPLFKKIAATHKTPLCLPLAFISLLNTFKTINNTKGDSSHIVQISFRDWVYGGGLIDCVFFLKHQLKH